MDHLRETGKLPTNAKTGVVTSDNGKHERSDDETTNLNGLTTDNLDESNGEEVSWHVSRGGDDQVTESSNEEGVVLVAALCETNQTEEDGLVEVDTVKGNVDEEPGGRSSDEDLEMAPLGEVGGESSPARCLEVFVGDLLLDSQGGSVLLGGDLLVGWEGEGGGGGVCRAGDGGEFAGLHEFPGFGHGETEVESDGTGDDDETELETPDGVEGAVVPVGEGVAEDEEENDGHDGAEQVTLGVCQWRGEREGRR